MGDKGNYNQTNEIEIDIFDILRDVAKDFWLIIIFGISAAFCAYMIANIIYKPSYKTSATFVVTSKGYNDIYTNLAAANTVAETMTSIFSSNILENKVVRDIGMKTLSGTIETAVINDTNLFELTVTASSPDMAFRIITSIMNNYTSVTSDVFGNAVLDLLQAPDFPAYPNNPLDSKCIMFLAFLLGMAVMTTVLAGLSIIKDDIKNETEITKKLDAKLFGTVYHENKYKTLRTKIERKKKSILINSPTVSFAFVENIKKMRSKFEYKASQTGRNVLLVTSVLENEGKSTIATNLALSLAQKSYKVMLIDADFYNPSVHKLLQKDENSNEETDESIVELENLKSAHIYDQNSGLHLLFGRKLYKNSTDLLAGDSFQKLISQTKKIMDYIIIDAPPITSAADTEILADVADVSLLVIRQSMAITKNINDAIDILTTSKSELLGCVFNNVHKSPLAKHTDYGGKYSYKHYYGDYEKNTSTQES